MTAPDPNAPKPEPVTPPAPVTPNAPAFTDTSAAAEITRLNGLLEAERNKTADLTQQVTTLEAQVDTTKQAELEQRLAALEAENATLKTTNETLTAAEQTRQATASLTGKVRDPEAALRLVTDDLKDKDGNPDPEKIIAKYPYLAPEGTATPTAPNGAGGVQQPATTTLDAAIAAGDVNAINAAFNAELKGGN